MKGKKIIIAASLTAIITTSMSIGAFAATNLEEISAYLNKGLGLKLNGKAWQPKDEDGNALYPISYNGSTYLPARAVAEALGTSVGYDSATNTVLIGEGAPQAEAKPANAPGKLRSTPAPIGTMVDVAVKDFLNEYAGNVSVDQVIRGEEAWKLIQSANKLNSTPKDGEEYMLAKISVKVTSSKDKDKQVDISGHDFTLVSQDGKDYEKRFVVLPSPELNAKLYEGASHTGWAVFIVKKDDANPVIAFGRKYDGSGGFWFSTK